MNAHFMRHKSRLEFFVHRCGEFYRKGSTMVALPLFLFNRWRPNGAAKPYRAKLAALLREVRRQPSKYAEFKALAPF